MQARELERFAALSQKAYSPEPDNTSSAASLQFVILRVLWGGVNQMWSKLSSTVLQRAMYWVSTSGGKSSSRRKFPADR